MSLSHQKHLSSLGAKQWSGRPDLGQRKRPGSEAGPRGAGIGSHQAGICSHPARRHHPRAAHHALGSWWHPRRCHGILGPVGRFGLLSAGLAKPFWDTELQTGQFAVRDPGA